MSSQIQPQSRTDMLSWSRFEAGQYSLDWQASVLYELEGLSHEADTLTAGSHNDIFGQVGWRDDLKEKELRIISSQAQ